jgi:UDP-N-acetylmuramyl pentapeptide phosphotransferase/UDP-N-acetylglucosamine-1-phosphate transferase
MKGGNKMLRYLLAFLTSFLIVIAITPLLIKLAIKLEFVDKPTQRKNHKAPVPLIGGVGMFLGFMIGYVTFVNHTGQRNVAVILGASIIMGIGIVDDWYKTKGKEFPVLPRLFLQILSAILVYNVGIRFVGFTNPFSNEYILFPIWVQFLLTITWIFGVTTVINFSDGMDGLAGGLCTISGTTLFIVAVYMQQDISAMMSILLVGACLGFLKYNRFPAKTFMGDSGANFLGFILAVISLDGAFKHATLISIFVPVLALGLPIFDNIFVVLKRFVLGKPVYKADGTQMHHRLLKTGLSPRQVVMMLYLISMCLNLTSIIIMLLPL